jgi:glycosyltransferase involved in cell wall biosynthesis
LPEDGTIFGFAFDPSSGVERKNVQGVINAFIASFKSDDRSYLVIKVNGREHRSYEYEMLRARAQNDRILFFDEPLDRAATYDFLASLDVYVSLHRSEGFGLTCAESMALGLPVIATNYSGNLDFMDSENSMLVQARVIETDRPYGPYPTGTHWADPDLEAAGDLMRLCLDSEHRRHLGEKARDSVRARLDARVIGQQVAALLQPSIAHCSTTDTSTDFGHPRIEIFSTQTRSNISAGRHNETY